jgi:hypothetical protein
MAGSKQGEFFVIGGENRPGHKFRDAWLFDGLVWVSLPELPWGVSKGVASVEAVDVDGKIEMHVLVISGRHLLTLKLGEKVWKDKDLGERVNVSTGVRIVAKLNNRADNNAICFLLLGNRSPSYLLSIPGFDPRVKFDPGVSRVRTDAYKRLVTPAIPPELVIPMVKDPARPELPERVESVVRHPVLGLRGFFACLGVEMAQVKAERIRKTDFVVRLPDGLIDLANISPLASIFAAAACDAAVVAVRVAEGENKAMVFSPALQRDLHASQQKLICKFGQSAPSTFIRLVHRYGGLDISGLLAEVNQNGGLAIVLMKTRGISNPDDLQWLRPLLSRAPKSILDYAPAFDVAEVGKALKRPLKEVEIFEGNDTSSPNSRPAWSAKVAFYAKATFGVLLYSENGQLIRRLHGHLPQGPKSGKLGAIVQVKGLEVDGLLADFTGDQVEKLIDKICTTCEEYLTTK